LKIDMLAEHAGPLPAPGSTDMKGFGSIDVPAVTVAPVIVTDSA
jgi:hypothetical protein